LVDNVRKQLNQPKESVSILKKKYESIMKDLNIDIKKQRATIELKDKEIKELKRFPDKKGLDELVKSFINSETIQESAERIMKDDTGTPV
jgi:hypothetical protein